LDEIGEMHFAAIQAKLLRVLEDGRVRRLGGDKAEVQVDVPGAGGHRRGSRGGHQQGRTAPGSVLPPERSTSRCRLSAITRGIALIAEILLRDLNKKHSGRVGLDQAVLEQLEKQDQQGNIREFRNVLERGVIVAEKERSP